jgi:hypothetical protein
VAQHRANALLPALRVEPLGTGLADPSQQQRSRLRGSCHPKRPRNAGRNLLRRLLGTGVDGRKWFAPPDGITDFLLQHDAHREIDCRIFPITARS